jgi:hypothetical protein
MTGRAEVARLEQRLSATFKRVGGVGADLELQADFARYLCVLVSGYLEKAVAELVLEHARKANVATLQRFVDRRTRRFANANSEKLKGLLGSFDQDWRDTLETFVIDDLKDAVDSLAGLRNRIAHGESVGVTYRRISDYYSRIQKVVDCIADLCDPL